MKVVITNLMLVSLLILTTSCFSSMNVGQTLTKSNDNISVQKSNDAVSQPSDYVDYPEIKALPIEISESSVSRLSAKEDIEGYFLPPFTSAEIQNIWFDAEPKIGLTATIVPVGTNVSPIDLEIIGKKKIKHGDNILWEVNLKKTTDDNFLQADPLKDRGEQYPFDVCVLYPAIKNAKSISRQELGETSLPRGVKLNSIYAAIDVTQDNQPDYIIVHHCRSGDDVLLNCESAGSSIYLKDGKSWKVYTSEGD